MTTVVIEQDDLDNLFLLARNFCYCAMTSHHATDPYLEEEEKELDELFEKYMIRLGET